MTTIASSMTMPIESTSPNIDRLFSENPNTPSTAQVPMIETGMASRGISAVRQLCRNRMTTITTRIVASSSVRCTSFTELRMYSLGL